MIRKIPVMFLSAILIFILGGCQMIRIEEGEVSPVEYTIVSQEDNIPAEALSLIQEKREKEFQLTYQSGEDLYLIKGYGRQMTGGYSIAVEELGIMGKVLRFKTKLMGPSENAGGEPSYPCIVVKTKYRKEPVEFR